MGRKSIQRKPDGTVVVTVRLTFKPGRDDRLIELVAQAPRRGLAATIREAMRSGVSVETLIDEEDDLDLMGMGMEL